MDAWVVWIGTGLHHSTCRYTVHPAPEGEGMSCVVNGSPSRIVSSHRPQNFIAGSP